MGLLVESKIIKNNQRQINVGDLNNGIYILEIKTKNWTKSQELIIRR